MPRFVSAAELRVSTERIQREIKQRVRVHVVLPPAVNNTLERSYHLTTFLNPLCLPPPLYDDLVLGARGTIERIE